MSEEGPKLFTNKPKKSKLKQSTPISMASTSSTGAAAAPLPRPLPPLPPPPPPPSLPQKESFVRRYRFLWPLLLVVNFTIGAAPFASAAYVLMRTTTKSTSASEEETPAGPTTTTTPSSTAATSPITEKPTITPTIIEKPIITPTIIEPVVRAPIPEGQQQELFKWMLEEKRKVKPRDAEEKKRIDEEKAILKQFIRAKSTPSL